jgi:D-arginine dehydrogenase
MSGASSYDAIVIGAGMAGASIAAELARDMSVLLVEMEEQPGYHATGRSVAFWSESYGGPHVQPLTHASLPFLDQPDPDFAEAGFLGARGAIHIGRAGDEPLRDALMTQFAGTDIFHPLDAPALRQRMPGLRPEWTLGLEEPGTRDIDVAALHAAYLRAFARRGGTQALGQRFDRAARQGDDWRVVLKDREVTAGRIINAAGAWTDDVARACSIRPLGIAPLLRTVVQLRVSPPVPCDLPLILDLAENFYFKPVGDGRIWLTPHDERPVPAGDVAPEEIDIALAIDRLQQVVDWRVDAVERKWAGLRSFAPDRLPVYGPDPDAPTFFWYAGQGGFGIQTAPAAAQLAHRLICGGDACGIDVAAYLPARFINRP